VVAVKEPSDLQHECPMCGERMRLRTHTRVRQVPGLPEQKTIEITEWECPECDYFEEFDEDTHNARS
jgi:C4-type Zn-finger protein